MKRCFEKKKKIKILTQDDCSQGNAARCYEQHPSLGAREHAGLRLPGDSIVRFGFIDRYTLYSIFKVMISSFFKGLLVTIWIEVMIIIIFLWRPGLINRDLRFVLYFKFQRVEVREGCRTPWVPSPSCRWPWLRCPRAVGGVRPWEHLRRRLTGWPEGSPGSGGPRKEMWQVLCWKSEVNLKCTR